MRRPAPALATVSLLIAAAVLTSGCQGRAAARSTATPARTPTVTATPTTAAVTATPAALPSGPPTRARLAAALPAAPAGSTTARGRLAGPTGQLTPRQYLTAEFGATEAGKLLAGQVQGGLTAGAARSWRQRDGVQVRVTVAGYRDRGGAKAFYLQLAYVQEFYDAGAVHFTLPGAIDSTGIGATVPDTDGTTEAELFVLAGDTVLHVVLVSPHTADRAAVTALAAGAYSRLCALSDCSAGSTS